MTGDESPTARVASPDGTEIAYWTTGHGPDLVVVHGTAADHTRWRPLLPHLEPHVRVHAVDRRGRGASGDGPEYTVQRESEDVAAVVDAVAAASGRTVDVYGHSHGGFVAFGAAALTSNVGRLVLYEGWPVPDPAALALPDGVDARMEELLAAGDRDAVVELMFRTLLDMSDEDVATYKSAPSWPGRVAAAHTITREIRATAERALDPATAAAITLPVLLLVGEHSVDPARWYVDAVADALPDARVDVLEGQEHVADALAPQQFAEHLLAFLAA